MMMKKIILLWVVLFSITLHSQQKESREKIRALKVAYLTENLELTADEAEKFWPIYNRFDKEGHKLKYQIRSKMRKAHDHKKEFGLVSEEESKELVESSLLIERKLLELEERFINDVSKVISYQKILKLKVAEMNFAKQLMRKYRSKKRD